MAGRVAQLVALFIAASALAQPSYGPAEPGAQPTTRAADRAVVEAVRSEPVSGADDGTPSTGETADGSRQAAGASDGLHATPTHERVALPPVDRAGEPAGGERPDPPGGAGWLGVLGPLALVVILIVGASLVLRRAARASGGLVASFGAGGRAPAGLLEVLGRYPVGMGQTLVLLKIDRRVLLLAQSRTGRLGGAAFTTLAEFTDPDEVASLLVRARDEAGDSLAERFRAALKTFGPDEQPATIGPGQAPGDGAVASVRRRLDALRGGAA